MGVSSIYPSPPHLNYIDVRNLFNSMISFLARRNSLISEILYKVSNVILHGKTFLKANAREEWNDTIGSLVPNDTAGSQRRACPIAWGRRNAPKPDTKSPKASRREKGERVTSTKVVVSSSGLQASHVKHGVHMIKSQGSQERIWVHVKLKQGANMTIHKK